MNNIIKISSLTLVIILIFAFVACDNNVVPAFNNNLYYVDNICAETYTDYADAVQFDYDTHPELEDNGLFWTMYDESQGKVIGVNVNDTEQVQSLGTALVDPSKPTIINIHGVQLNSYAWTDSFSSIYYGNSTVLPPADYGFEDVVDMNKIWLDRGYNVMNYMYFRFADEFPMGKNGILSNKIIEAKMWSTDGPQKMAYRLSDGTFSHTYNKQGALSSSSQYPELEYCLAEYFAGDYIRALDSVEGLADNEIRITCHSMGNTLTLSGVTLLGELARVGQIDISYLPDRIAILDGYLGMPATGSVLDLPGANTDLHIRWSGKTLSDVGLTETYYECVKQLVLNYDMPIEYYIDANGFVVQPSGEWIEKIKEYCATAYYDLEFSGMINDHNAVRELYHASYTADNPPLDTTNADITAYAISAKSSVEDIKARRGFVYQMVDGKNSSNPANHSFVRIDDNIQ